MPVMDSASARGLGLALQVLGSALEVLGLAEGLWRRSACPAHGGHNNKYRIYMPRIFMRGRSDTPRRYSKSFWGVCVLVFYELWPPLVYLVRCIIW